jgi:hypothetical protein
MDWKALDRQYKDNLTIPPFLRVTPKDAERRRRNWERNPPRAMFLPVEKPKDKALRERQERDRRERSLARLRSHQQRRNHRDALPPDFKNHPDKYRWDTRRSCFIIDDLAHLSRPKSGLVENVAPAAELKRTPARAKSTPKDDLVARLRAYDLKALTKFAKANACWDAKYAALPNVGLVRMNVVNRLRGAVRKGHEIKWL